MTPAVHGEPTDAGRGGRERTLPDIALAIAFFAFVWLANVVAAILALWAAQELGIVAPLEASGSIWPD